MNLWPKIFILSVFIPFVKIILSSSCKSNIHLSTQCYFGQWIRSYPNEWIRSVTVIKWVPGGFMCFHFLLFIFCHCHEKGQTRLLVLIKGRETCRTELSQLRYDNVSKWLPKKFLPFAKGSMFYFSDILNAVIITLQCISKELTFHCFYLC